MLGGCSGLPSVGPDYQIPDTPIPARWQAGNPASSERQDLSTWWRQLDDPLLARLIADFRFGDEHGDFHFDQQDLYQLQAIAEDAAR